MAGDAFDALLRRMERSGVASPAERVGCTAAQIARVEARCGVRLPATYRRFLGVMGRGSGRLFAHDRLAVHYADVLRLTARVPRVVRGWAADFPAWAAFGLPAGAVVILHRDDSDDFHFLRCDRADDSAVWHFGPDVRRPRRVCGSVLGWLRGWCAEAEQAVADGYYR